MPRRKDKEITGVNKTQLDHAKRRILATQNICGICGRPVDKTIPYPHPLSASVDHIIPINRGGHPFSIDNLQLAHLSCNIAKRDNLMREDSKPVESNRNLPMSRDWRKYRSTAN